MKMAAGPCDLVVEAVASVLADHGHPFVPDDRLGELRAALDNFLEPELLDRLPESGRSSQS